MTLSRFLAFAISACVCVTGTAASVRFDFGDGDVDANTMVAANFVIAENASLGAAPGEVSQTIDGVQLTISPVIATGADFSESSWGANDQGIGIRSYDAGGSNAIDSGSNGGQRRRIAGSVGEAIQFSFDTDVTIESIRLGSLAPDTNAGTIEVAELSFVSGVDPFGGGGPFQFASDANDATLPTEDLIVDVFVEAGTVLSLSTNPANTTASGVLWNDIVVSVIPEAASFSLLLIGMLSLLASHRRPF